MKNKKSVLILTGLNILAAILSLGYSVMQVYFFGVSRDIEIYFASTSVLYLILSLTQVGQLGEIFLPVYHKLKTGSQDNSGFRAISVIVNWLLIFTGLVCLIAFLLSPFLINIIIPGFSVEDRILAASIFRFSVFFILLEILNSFLTTILNAEKIYGKTEFTNVINVIISILVLFIFYNSLGIWSLAIGLATGKTVQFLMTIYYLKRIDFKYFFILKSEGFNHQSYFSSMISTLLYVGATQFYNIVLTSSISFLPEGIFAVFKYVQNLFIKVKGIFIRPVNTVFYTEFSSNFSLDKTKANEVLGKSLDLSLFILLTVLLFTIIFGDRILYILWSGEKFSDSYLHLAYHFLIFNFAGLIFVGIGSIYRRIAMVFGKAKFVYLMLTIAQLLTSVIAYCLIRIFGTEGLKWVILINVLLLHGVSYLTVFLQDKKLCFQINPINSGRIIILFISIIIIGLFFDYLLEDFLILPDSKVTVFIELFTLSLIILPIYLLLGYVLKITELESVFQLFKSRLRSKKI